MSISWVMSQVEVQMAASQASSKMDRELVFDGAGVPLKVTRHTIPPLSDISRSSGLKYANFLNSTEYIISRA